MNTSRQFQQQRTDLRLRLQAQRLVIANKLFPPRLLSSQAGSGADSEPAFPRSMIMRLLTRHHTMTLILVREVAPLFIRYYLGKYVRKLAPWL